MRLEASGVQTRGVCSSLCSHVLLSVRLFRLHLHFCHLILPPAGAHHLLSTKVRCFMKGDCKGLPSACGPPLRTSYTPRMLATAQA